VANIGGFVIGFVFALVGGALSISWAPGEPESTDGTPLAEHPDEERPKDELHAAAVPQQQGAGYDLAADTDGGGHRAG
ncbi:hypothetical protein G3M58_89410, partial [Streptomyces sp. SID7499]|nr:hypothetical protein [Streptomyces sp. SID7499]